MDCRHVHAEARGLPGSLNAWMVGAAIRLSIHTQYHDCCRLQWFENLPKYQPPVLEQCLRSRLVGSVVFAVVALNFHLGDAVDVANAGDEVEVSGAHRHLDQELLRQPFEPKMA